MKKVISFLGIPLTIALILSIVFAGVVYAYSAWQGTTSVTVEEAITVTGANGNGSYAGNVWTISTKPGETQILTLTVHNSSSVPLTITASATGSYPGLTLTPTSPGSPIPAGGDGSATFTLVAASDVTPISNLAYNLYISR